MRFKALKQLQSSKCRHKTLKSLKGIKKLILSYILVQGLPQRNKNKTKNEKRKNGFILQTKRNCLIIKYFDFQSAGY